MTAAGKSARRRSGIGWFFGKSRNTSDLMGRALTVERLVDDVESATGVSSPPSSTIAVIRCTRALQESSTYLGVVRDSDRKTTALLPSV